MPKKLYVYNISYDATEQDLRAEFSEYGGVASVRIISDRTTGKPRGFAFIEMASERDAELALALDNQFVGGRRIRVSYARETSRPAGRAGDLETGGTRGRSEVIAVKALIFSKRF